MKIAVKVLHNGQTDGKYMKLTILLSMFFKDITSTGLARAGVPDNKIRLLAFLISGTTVFADTVLTFRILCDSSTITT